MDSDSDNNSVDEAIDHFYWSLGKIQNNDPQITMLDGDCSEHNITRRIGRDISNNTHLTDVELRKAFNFDILNDEALSDDKMSHLFRGLTKSSSIKDMCLMSNNLSATGVKSMVPFLQHANNLRKLDLGGNNIQSEGFEILLRALRGSPIQTLSCMSCGIESIEIDIDYFPKQIRSLFLGGNGINADGCREIAKLLRGDSTLSVLELGNSPRGKAVDDEGVTILVNALRNNKSLKTLLIGGISKEGQIMLLKLVNDISSIKATLQSNHTLTYIHVQDFNSFGIAISDEVNKIHYLIKAATKINEDFEESNPEAAGREKVIRTQLLSVSRAKLTKLHGVNQSLYSEVDPLHLPEVLSLIGRRHGQGELYVAFKSSVAEVMSTVNKKQCIKDRMKYHAAQLEELGAEHAAIEVKERGVEGIGDKLRSNKRLRV